jgi:hypothetical protein
MSHQMRLTDRDETADIEHPMRHVELQQRAMCECDPGYVRRAPPLWRQVWAALNGRELKWERVK